MTQEEFNTQLYQKMFEEQEKYRDWLLSQPPEEIINHCYEYTIREDILMCVECNDDLPEEQCKALLKLDAPLADIFKDFANMETNHMDDIRDTIESRANAVLRADFIRSQYEER